MADDNAALPLFNQPKERTLEEARKTLFENIREGTECPCCGQLAKVYQRKFNSIMARSMIAFWLEDREHPKEWLHALQVLQRRMPSVQGSGDYGKLHYWGLLVAKADETDDGNSAGLFRLTEKGRRFVVPGGIIPKYKYLYNDREWPVTEETPQFTTLKDALGSHFDYDKLMKG